MDPPMVTVGSNRRSFDLYIPGWEIFRGGLASALLTRPFLHCPLKAVAANRDHQPCRCKTGSSKKFVLPSTYEPVDAPTHDQEQ